MIDPRFAIMEATAMSNNRIRIGYFVKDDVCSVAIPYETFFSSEAKGLVANNSKSITSNKLSQYFKAKEAKTNNIKAKDHHFESSRCSHIYSDQFKAHGTAKKVTTKSAIEVSGITHSKGDMGNSETFDEDKKENSLEVLEEEKTCLILDLPSGWKKQVDKGISDD
jgi:hypothetical protein